MNSYISGLRKLTINDLKAKKFFQTRNLREEAVVVTMIKLKPYNGVQVDSKAINLDDCVIFLEFNVTQKSNLPINIAVYWILCTNHSYTNYEQKKYQT